MTWDNRPGINATMEQLQAEITRLRDALLAECERCAKIADEFPPTMLHIYDRPGGPPGNSISQTTGRDIGAAIRASFRRDDEQ